MLKLLLWLNRHNAMAQMEVRGQLHIPATLSTVKSSVTAGLNMMVVIKRKIDGPAGNRNPVVRPAASHYTDFTITAHECAYNRRNAGNYRIKHDKTLNS
jgi:hypothetical protein